jgi:hypothetical protein
MKTNINGVDHRVRFEYRHGKNIGHKALNQIKNRRIITVAKIQKKGEDGTWVDIATGESIRNPKDQFRKATGRRIALGKALKAAQLPLQARLDIWDQYFDQHRDGVDLMVGDLTNCGEPVQIKVQ